MRSSHILAFLSAVVSASASTSGQLRSLHALDRIMGRQVRLCTPVSTPSCALSCGAGFVTCVSWPTCYNPSRGDSCCSSGSYCRTGYYCTDKGCCPNGASLAECGATRTLSVIPPPVAESTTAASSSTTSASHLATTTTTAAISSSSSTTSSTTSSSPSSSSTTTSSSTSTRSPTPVITPTTTRTSNGTTTSTPPVQVSNAAGAMGVGAAQAVLGGLVMLAAL